MGRGPWALVSWGRQKSGRISGHDHNISVPSNNEHDQGLRIAAGVLKLGKLVEKLSFFGKTRFLHAGGF